MDLRLDRDHVVRRDWLPLFAIIWMSFTSLLVILRIALRAASRNLGLDDALLLPSWIIYIAFASIATFASKAGLIDRHTQDMQPSNFPVFALTAWLSEFLFLIGTCCLKVSVLLFFRRMVKDLFERRWQIAIWAGVCFIIIHTLVFAIILAWAFNCVDYLTRVNKSGIPGARVSFCLHTSRSVLAAGVLSIISDLYAILLPWVITRRLSLPIRQKNAMNAIFMFSTLIIIIAACFRTNALLKFHKMQDPSWRGFEANVAAMIEWGMGIICVCVPSLRCFYRFCRSSDVGQRIFSRPTEMRSGREDVEQPQQQPFPRHYMESLHSLARPASALCKG